MKLFHLNLFDMFQRKNKLGAYDPNEKFGLKKKKQKFKRTIFYDHNDKRPIFIQSDKLFFAYSGGRFIVMNDQLQWQDFGNGGGRNDNEGTINHEYFGQIKGEGLCLTFEKYSTTFDFGSLKNCYFLENNKIRGKRDVNFYMYPVHHLKRFAEKRLKFIFQNTCIL